jgi:NiFe hydrogenase small subunit HydA
MDGSHAVSRRDFVRICTMAAAAVGLSTSAAAQVAEAVTKGLKPSIIWLHFQECTGCTESLLRTSAPGLAEVILDLVSLDYHETLFAAAGHQAEAALHSAMQANRG